jgi:hypothetical protein
VANGGTSRTIAITIGTLRSGAAVDRGDYIVIVTGNVRSGLGRVCCCSGDRLIVGLWLIGREWHPTSACVDGNAFVSPPISFVCWSTNTRCAKKVFTVDVNSCELSDAAANDGVPYGLVRTAQVRYTRNRMLFGSLFVDNAI